MIIAEKKGVDIRQLHMIEETSREVSTFHLLYCENRRLFKRRDQPRFSDILARIGFYGQVPQIGLGSVQLVAPVSKLGGAEGIRETHQEERSWLKELASLNIAFMP